MCVDSTEGDAEKLVMIKTILENVAVWALYALQSSKLRDINKRHQLKKQFFGVHENKL